MKKFTNKTIIENPINNIEKKIARLNNEKKFKRNITILLIKFFLVLTILIFSFAVCGCQSNYTYVNIAQDNKNTGGNLTYSYDISNQTLTIGKEGETILYYEKNIARGWMEDGCRIGLKFSPPQDLKNFQAIKVSINGKETNEISFLQVNEQRTGEFEIFPLIEEIQNPIEVSVLWNSNSQAQKYIIKINENTQLMEK